MKKITFILILTFFLSYTHASIARVNAEADGTIVEVKHGFPFETYEKWIDFLEKKYSGFNKKRFMEIYPQKMFEQYKQTIDFQSIMYMSDELKVAGYIIKPKQTNGRKLPVIIYNRGGNRSFGQLVFSNFFSLFELVSDGYILTASQYRGNAGGEGIEEFGGADVNDVLNLIPLIESIPEADASRIGMYGWSRGGMMTYIALAKTNRISAAIIGAGVSDLFDTNKRRPEMESNVHSQLIPNYRNNKSAELTARSAVKWPEKLNKKTPILLLHGSSDWRVDPGQSLKMASLLYDCKHPFRFVFFEGGDHSLSEHKKEVNRLVKEWLDRYVRDKQPWPSLEPHGR